MLSSQKAKRVLLVLLAALASVVAVLLCAAAVFAWQEMTHEGLTSSQWYQGAIESFSLARDPVVSCKTVCQYHYHVVRRRIAVHADLVVARLHIFFQHAVKHFRSDIHISGYE